MDIEDGRTDKYKPQYLYIEDHPLTIEEIERIKTKEKEDDDDGRGVIIIEIL